MVRKKLKEVESQIEALWAQYGRLQAEREQLTATLQQRVQQMRNIQAQIAGLEATLLEEKK